MARAAAVILLFTLAPLHGCGSPDSGGPTCCRCTYRATQCMGDPCVFGNLETTVHDEAGLGDTCEQVCVDTQPTTTEAVDCSDEPQDV